MLTFLALVCFNEALSTEIREEVWAIIVPCKGGVHKRRRFKERERPEGEWGSKANR